MEQAGGEKKGEDVVGVAGESLRVDCRGRRREDGRLLAGAWGEARQAMQTVGSALTVEQRGEAGIAGGSDRC